MEEDGEYSEVELSEEEDETPAELSTPEPVVQRKNLGRRRVSVSAEVYNPNQKKEPTKKHEKPEEAKQRIRAIMRDNVLFSGLDEEQITEVIDSVFEEKYASGATIITQGEAGDLFYILDEGMCEVYLKDNDGESMVHKYNSGDSFGELALMYNAPRAATVKAASECVVWAMDRQTFRSVLLDSAHRKRTLYEQFLEDVPLLKSLEPSERAAIADVLEPCYFEEGEDIIKQGEPGETFYILEEGSVAAKSSGIELMKYSRGDYFGELALLTDEPRKATCTALERSKCVWFNRKSFKRLLGKLEKILERNKEMYEEVMRGIAK
eukprot:CAMPEP_0170146100 /NCGR_PEP_ID=MMETSP0033_2-20121228/28175_1 /TAXON_ID=195969 /ORGANISM="Dolichomastix tenuilepis, Strain CCMP3274" /LENGTH=321 /DNA_ID=CAMNT_0010382779 /DNA_START=94 /DNA_END=1059 /DNA_ORIENTATION=+